MNRVRVAVRRIVLDGKPFTASDIERRTGLNLESIRTEIQRLRKDDFIETCVLKNTDRTPSGRVRGAPVVTYCLTHDTARIRELRESVASFYVSVPIIRTAKPTSEHFVEAREAIHNAAKAADVDAKESLLANAELDLEAAWLAEGDEGATDELKAHLLFQSATLKLVQGHFEEARQQFTQCWGVFLAHSDHDSALAARDNILACEIELGSAEERSLAYLRKMRGKTTNSLALAILGAVESSDEVQLEDEYLGNDIAGRELSALIGEELEACGAALS